MCARAIPSARSPSLNHGFGPDLVIECTGQLDGWQQSLARVRRGGRVVFFGGCAPGTTLNVDTRRMHYDNLTLLAPFHFRPRDVKRAFQILSGGAIGADAIINARRSLDELAEVFSLLESGIDPQVRDHSIKRNWNAAPISTWAAI